MQNTALYTLDYFGYEKSDVSGRHKIAFLQWTKENCRFCKIVQMTEKKNRF